MDHFYLQHVQNFKKGSLDKPQVYEICVLLKNLYLVKCQANILQTQKFELGKELLSSSPNEFRRHKINSVASFEHMH